MDRWTMSWKYKDLIQDVGDFDEIVNLHAPELPSLWNENNIKLVHRLLFNKFCNSTVAFDMKDDFYQQFANIIYNEFDYFIQKMEIIKQIRSLKQNELLREYETITNVSNNDNEINESALTNVLPYISTQSSSTSKTNVLVALTRAVREYKDNECNYFLDKFKHLFTKLYSDTKYFYERGWK